MNLRLDAQMIMREAIAAVQPGSAVERAMKDLPVCHGKRILLAVGKAAPSMAAAAMKCLGASVSQGIVITKYGYQRPLPGSLRCFEAGHPVPDQNTYQATDAVLQMVDKLQQEDQVVLLLSGGGSSLFESPLIRPEELADITRQLLASGADITQINTIRKRLSAVKGGKFALRCAPAQVFTVVLSDIVGDPLDMIASGPTYPDASTCGQACEIISKYHLRMSPEAQHLVQQETPKTLPNVHTVVTGSVKQLCAAAAKSCKSLGYTPVVLTQCLCIQAKDAGAWLAQLARQYSGEKRRVALLAGGETVVKLTGTGLGGRNQEVALSAAEEMAGLQNAAIFSFGSDGTDGPTDAAGGYVDGTTKDQLLAKGICIDRVLQNNDAYHALQAVNGLLFTGPTGTNVNDLSVALINVGMS